ncbi:MAG: hypothetical protein IKI31_04220 [Treponema sp.]|nr:hypothetical protein [Treponema sp.]
MKKFIFTIFIMSVLFVSCARIGTEDPVDELYAYITLEEAINEYWKEYEPRGAIFGLSSSNYNFDFFVGDGEKELIISKDASFVWGENGDSMFFYYCVNGQKHYMEEFPITDSMVGRKLKFQIFYYPEEEASERKKLMFRIIAIGKESNVLYRQEVIVNINSPGIWKDLFEYLKTNSLVYDYIQTQTKNGKPIKII